MKTRLFTFFIFTLFISLISLSGSYAQYHNDDPTGLAPYVKVMNPLPVTVAADNILSWNSRAFGEQASSSGTWGKGTIKMFLNNPSGAIYMSTDAGANFLSAGAFNSTGTWYGIRYYTKEIYTIDTTTGVMTQVGTVTGAVNIMGMAWDYSTNQMYVLDIPSTGNIQLGILNMTTYVSTPIGSPVASNTIIDIGISNAGVVYGHRFTTNTTNSEIVTINKTTNAVTLIGSTGFIGYYAQGMSFDHSTDSLYLAAYNYTTGATSGGELRSVNLTTGATTIIGSPFGAYNEVDAFAIPGAPGPGITHTPLPNTQNVAGPYTVNAVVTPQGSAITTAKVFWSRNNAVLTDSVTMTNSSGTNWTGNFPGNGSTALYRYQIKAWDALNRVGQSSVMSFTATATDTTKPVITFTPLGEIPRTTWPKMINCSATDLFGIDSVWVKWYKNTPSSPKRFNLANGSGNNWAGAFNSDTSQIAIGDSIFYRIIARDNSAQHNLDSTALYQSKIINQITAIIGTESTSSNFPFTTYWKDGRTQYLYLASELGFASGYVTQIGFDVLTVGAPVMTGFTVSFKNTSLTTLTTWETGGFTAAYNPTSYAPSGTGWNMINLSSPFYYTAGSNLLVDICYNNTTYTSYSTVKCSAAPNMYYGRYNDLTEPTGGCGYTAWTLTTGPVGRANTTLVMNPGPVGVGNENTTMPTVYSLSQNYPNPFNPTTKINFALPKQGLVTLKIYDILGREVRTLVNEVKAAGSYTVDFNASEFSSGVYFYRLQSQGFTDIKKMMLIK
ncbi:MAG: T9SS type A sorting domain-containing protein [Candidatus Kapaibacterium sp.]